MTSLIHGVIKWLWPEAIVASIVLLAFVTLVVNGAGLDKQPWLARAIDTLIPLFIIVVLVQLYWIRTEGRQDVVVHETFTTGDEFDDYLRSRLNRANEVRVIHISSGTSQASRAYPSVIDSYLKKGKAFSRIFSDSANLEVVEWIWKDLKKYQDNQYNFFLLFARHYGSRRKPAPSGSC